MCLGQKASPVREAVLWVEEAQHTLGLGARYHSHTFAARYRYQREVDDDGYSSPTSRGLPCTPLSSRWWPSSGTLLSRRSASAACTLHRSVRSCGSDSCAYSDLHACAERNLREALVV